MALTQGRAIAFSLLITVFLANVALSSSDVAYEASSEGEVEELVQEGAQKKRVFTFRWNAKGIKEHTDDAEDRGWNGKGAEVKNSLGVNIINGKKNLGNPKKYGYVASDAYTGPKGHYYIGRRRRRIGAGFGRRRRTPSAGAEWWADHKFKSYAMWKKHSIVKAALKKPTKKRRTKLSKLSPSLHRIASTKRRSAFSRLHYVSAPKYPAGFSKAGAHKAGGMQFKKLRVCHSDCMRLSLAKRLCSACKVHVPIMAKGERRPKKETKPGKRAVGEYCCGCPRVKCASTSIALVSTSHAETSGRS